MQVLATKAQFSLLNENINLSLSDNELKRRTDNTMAKRKSTKDKQRSTKHTHKTKDRVTRSRIPLKYGGELGCS
jgi:regulator of replication initiation timing